MAHNKELQSIKFFPRSARSSWAYEKKYVDQEKTEVEKIEVRPNLRFNQGDDKTDDALEEDLPIGTVHMVRGLNHPNLENMIKGDIRIIKQMDKVLSVHPAMRKPRQGLSEP